MNFENIINRLLRKGYEVRTSYTGNNKTACYLKVLDKQGTEIAFFDLMWAGGFVIQQKDCARLEELIA